MPTPIPPSMPPVCLSLPDVEAKLLFRPDFREDEIADAELELLRPLLEQIMSELMQEEP